MITVGMMAGLQWHWLIWVVLIPASLGITVLFDYLNRGDRKGLEIWQHWWHSLGLLVITFVAGVLLGLLLNSLGVPAPGGFWLLDEGMSILWMIIFVVLHLLLIVWLSVKIPTSKAT